MNYTTNYNLNKPEGTDHYNHLTVDNPNMDIIDSALHANKLEAIGSANELVSGTVHALTRSDTDQNIFRFKATAAYTEGDTFTVDGVTVNAYLTSGQTLPDNAYVISSEVLCILDNTSLWFIVCDTQDIDTPINNLKTAISTWGPLETLATHDNVIIQGAINTTTKMALIIYITSTATAPSSETITLPTKWRPILPQTGSMRFGNGTMYIDLNNILHIEIATPTNWMTGSIMYALA